MGVKAESLCNSETTTGQSIFDKNPAKSSANALVAPIAVPAGSSGLRSSIAGVVPGRLRIADLEMDGFPDIVMTLQTSAAGSQTTVLKNIKSSDDTTRRELAVFAGFNEAISDAAGSDADFVTFMDIDEDGRLDFLIQHTSESESESGRAAELTVLYNNIFLDNFYIKAMMLNSEQTKSDNIYGDSVIGPSFRFVITDLEDQQFVVVGS
jgi:hypothetical protein